MSKGKVKIKANSKKKAIEKELGLVPKPKPSHVYIEEDINPKTEVIQFEDPNAIKARVENLAWNHIEKRLEKGFKDANALAKMVLEPYFPKTKINLTGNLKDMKRDQLIGHMKKLVDGK